MLPAGGRRHFDGEEKLSYYTDAKVGGEEEVRARFFHCSHPSSCCSSRRSSLHVLRDVSTGVSSHTVSLPLLFRDAVSPTSLSLSLSLSLSRPPPQGKRPATWTRPQTALFEVIRDAPAGDGATDWGTVRRGSVQTDWSSLRAQLSGGKAAGAQAAGDNWTSARDSVSGRLFFTATDGRCSWTVPAKLEFRVDGDGLACVNACDLFLFLSFFFFLSFALSDT